MSFMAPSAPKVYSSPPPPPTLANPNTVAAQNAAAAAAGGMGFGGTIKTSPLGAAAPTTAKQNLGGGS
jgi:hypothetical protein